MSEILLVLGLGMAVFVGYNIGGSTTGPAFGPAVGAGVISKLLAAALMSVFFFAGAWTRRCCIPRKRPSRVPARAVSRSRTAQSGVAIYTDGCPPAGGPSTLWTAPRTGSVQLAVSTNCDRLRVPYLWVAVIVIITLSAVTETRDSLPRGGEMFERLTAGSITSLYCHGEARHELRAVKHR